MITMKLPHSINKGFADNDANTQKLIKEQTEQRKIQTDKHTTVLGTLNRVQHGLELHVEETTRSKIRNNLLASLWFPEIDQRRSEIKEPAPRTLDWLFDSDSDSHSHSNSDSDSHSDSHPNAKWSDFRQWLRGEDASTYWICGKAGSGKSTLMAHIVDDERTCEH